MAKRARFPDRHSGQHSRRVPARSTSRWLRPSGIVGITLLALALGGSTGLEAQAVIIFVAAAIILVAPPHTSPGKVPLLLAGLMILLAFSAFLPCITGLMPEWRRHLQFDLRAPLGDLRTPQPWLTLQACGLLLFGVVWACYLFAQEWSPAEKSRSLRLLVAGLILLALVSIAAFGTGYRIPGWNQEQNRGWFPNRNQTADVLAMGGIVGYAVMSNSFRKRSWMAGPWLTGLIILWIALVISYSRAGIILFFIGVTIWQAGAILRPGSGKQLAIGMAALLFLLSLFFLFGGSTFERFFNVSQGDNRNDEDYRILIQEDALRVSRQAPFLGVGLGNFEPVFTSMRKASADQNRTLHPESDWLWMAVEMGWAAPLVVLFGIRWWVGQCLPFAYKSGEALRRAAMVATIIFLIHGVVDVAGHRLGSLMVGLLVAGLALASKTKISPTRWIAPSFRGLAVLLMLMSAWWMASCYTDEVPPTTATLERAQSRLEQAVAGGRLASMSEAANAALDISPLNWVYYFRRASAEAFRTGATDQAANDFHIARFLEPHWVDLCLTEGEVWMGVDESDRCIEAWQEALRRAGTTPRATQIYDTMLGLARDKPVIHDGLKNSASDSIELLITFLNYASPDEVKDEVNELLSRDPDLRSLTSVQQERLFRGWFEHGNRDDLVTALLQHTDWQVAGWRFLAENEAGQQDFQMACITTLRHLPVPVMPALSSDQSLAVLQNAFDNHPHDLAQGVMLYQAQIRENRTDDALTTLTVLTQNDKCPAYLFYLQAKLQMQKQQWEDAWNSFQHVGN